MKGSPTRPFQKGRKKTGGRKPGVPNKFTRDVKEAVLNAFQQLGGEAWLVKLGRRDPKSFAALLAKTMPQGMGAGPLNDPADAAHQIRAMLVAIDTVTA